MGMSLCDSVVTGGFHEAASCQASLLRCGLQPSIMDITGELVRKAESLHLPQTC